MSFVYNDKAPQVTYVLEPAFSLFDLSLLNLTLLHSNASLKVTVT